MLKLITLKADGSLDSMGNCRNMSSTRFSDACLWGDAFFSRHSWNLPRVISSWK